MASRNSAPVSTCTAFEFDYAVIVFGYTDRLIEPGPLFEGPFEELHDHRYVQVHDRKQLTPGDPILAVPGMTPQHEDVDLVYIDGPKFKLHPISTGWDIVKETLGLAKVPSTHIVSMDFIGTGKDAEGHSDSVAVEDIRKVTFVRRVFPMSVLDDSVVLRTTRLSDVMEYIGQVSRIGHCASYGIDDIQYATSTAGRKIVFVSMDSSSG